MSTLGFVYHLLSVREINHKAASKRLCLTLLLTNRVWPHKRQILLGSISPIRSIKMICVPKDESDIVSSANNVEMITQK